MLKPKKKKLQPLNDNDIMLAILRNQQMPDRTEQYKQWMATFSKTQNPALLIKNHKLPSLERQKPKIDVDSLHIPKQLLREAGELEVARRQIDEMINTQNSSHRIRERIQLYEQLLDKVLAMHANAREYYQGQVNKTEECLDDLREEVCKVAEKVSQSRKILKLTKEGLVVNPVSILKKLRRYQRIKQVLSIVGIWRATFLDNMKYFKENSVIEYGVQKVLNVIHQTRQRFKEYSTQYSGVGCFEKIEQFLSCKQKQARDLLNQAMDVAIIYFNAEQYGKILLNYWRMTQIMKITSKLKNLPLMLQNNFNNLIAGCLGEAKIEKIQNSSGTQFLQFFQKLLVQMQAHLHNWHLATRWHLEYSSEEQPTVEFVRKIGEEFLQFRKTIWTKSQQRIADMLSKSFRFYTLSLNQRSILMVKLYNFLKAGHFFSGAAGKMIPKILKQKLRDQNDLFIKQLTNLTKFALNRQLKTLILQEQIANLTLAQSYVCQLQEDELRKLDQLLNGEVSKQYEANGHTIIQQQHQLQLQYDKGFVFQKNSSSFYIQQGTLQMARRAYLQPRMNMEIYMKLKQIVQMVMYYVYRTMLSETYRKYLSEEWNAFYELKFNQLKDVEVNGGVLDYFMECLNKQNKCVKLRKEMIRISSKFEQASHKTFKREDLPLSNLVFMNQNLCAIVNWLKMNVCKLFNKASQTEKDTIQSDMNEMFDMSIELVTATYASFIDDLRIKYQPLFSMVADLKWEVKKYNSDNSHIYRQYKNKLFQVVSMLINGLRQLKYPQPINQRIEGWIVDAFFQVLQQIYSRIEKVNDNGTQLMKLDVLELSRMIESLGTPTSNSYKTHLEVYLNIWFFRDPKEVQKQIGKVIEHYPYRVWKHIVNTGPCSQELSSKQKRDFQVRLAQQYVELIKAKRIK